MANLEFYNRPAVNATVNQGISHVSASIKHGPMSNGNRLLLLRHAALLVDVPPFHSVIANCRNFSIPTRMKAVVLSSTDLITKRFVEKNGKFFTKIMHGGIEEYLEVAPHIVDQRNPEKKQLIKVENGWKTDIIGEKKVMTCLLPNNDQAIIELPEHGERRFLELKNLFFSPQELEKEQMVNGWMNVYQNHTIRFELHESELGLVQVSKCYTQFYPGISMASGTPEYLMVYSQKEEMKDLDLHFQN